MPLKLKSVVDDVTTLPEAVREAYTQGEDGKFYLDLDGVDEHPSVKSLKSAYERVKADEKRLRGRFGKLPDDIDAAKIEELLKRQQEEDEEKAKREGKFDDLKQQLLARHTEELAKRDQKERQLLKLVQKLAAEDALRAAIIEAGGKPKALLPMLLPRILVEIGETDVEIKVLDEHGKPQIGGANGEFKTIAQLVAEQKADADLKPLFTGVNSDGGGAPASKKGTSVSTGTGEKRTLKDFATDADRSEFIQKHGLPAYLEIVQASAEQPAAAPNKP